MFHHQPDWEDTLMLFDETPKYHIYLSHRDIADWHDKITTPKCIPPNIKKYKSFKAVKK